MIVTSHDILAGKDNALIGHFLVLPEADNRWQSVLRGNGMYFQPVGGLNHLRFALKQKYNRSPSRTHGERFVVLIEHQDMPVDH
jgi:hypothetical protein